MYQCRGVECPTKEVLRLVFKQMYVKREKAVGQCVKSSVQCVKNLFSSKEIRYPSKKKITDSLVAVGYFLPVYSVVICCVLPQSPRATLACIYPDGVLRHPK